MCQSRLLSYEYFTPIFFTRVHTTSGIGLFLPGKVRPKVMADPVYISRNQMFRCTFGNFEIFLDNVQDYSEVRNGSVRVLIRSCPKNTRTMENVQELCTGICTGICTSSSCVLLHQREQKSREATRKKNAARIAMRGCCFYTEILTIFGLCVL